MNGDAERKGPEDELQRLRRELTSAEAEAIAATDWTERTRAAERAGSLRREVEALENGPRTPFERRTNDEEEANDERDEDGEQRAA